jgi:hypothetical protein
LLYLFIDFAIMEPYPWLHLIVYWWDHYLSMACYNFNLAMADYNFIGLFAVILLLFWGTVYFFINYVPDNYMWNFLYDYEDVFMPYRPHKLYMVYDWHGHWRFILKTSTGSEDVSDQIVIKAIHRESVYIRFGDKLA